MLMSRTAADIKDARRDGLLLFCDLRATIEADDRGRVVVNKACGVFDIRVTGKVLKQRTLARVRITDHSYLDIFEFVSLLNKRHLHLKLLRLVLCCRVVRLSA